MGEENEFETKLNEALKIVARIRERVDQDKADQARLSEIKQDTTLEQIVDKLLEGVSTDDIRAQRGQSELSGGTTGGALTQEMLGDRLNFKVAQLFESNPGKGFRAEQICDAIGESKDKLDSIRALLSKMYKSKVVARPEWGVYVFKPRKPSPKSVSG